MTTPRSGDRELFFSPDFAARVMTQANTIRKRRRAWYLGVASAALAGMGVTVSAVLVVPARLAAPAPSMSLAAGPEERIDVPGDTRTDPLQVLFPDAVPVVRFADRYSEMAYGREGRAGELPLANDGEDAGDL